MPKAYTRGWRDRSTGDMNINVKIGNSYSASSTIMIHPLDKISTLIKSAVDFVAMGDDPLREFRKAVYFRKHDLADISNERIGQHFNGNETIYVKSFDGDEEVTWKGDV